MVGEERGDYASHAFGWGLVGAIVGGLFFFIIGFSILYTKGAIGFIVGFFSGASIGAIFGLIYRAVPRGIANFLAIVVVIAFFSITSIISIRFYDILPGYTQTAIKPFSNLADLVKAGFKCIGTKEEFSKCVAPLYKGWETETEKEVVSLQLRYITKDIFDKGSDEKIEAEITVINEPQQGEEGIEKFLLEPECYVGSNKVDAEFSGNKESGKLVFFQSKTPQTSSVKCKVSASEIKDKKKINMTIKLTRPVLASVEWAATTIKKEAQFEIIKSTGVAGSESRGAMVAYAGVLYKFGIGIGHDLPLTEGEHSDFYIELEKRISGEGKLKEIKYIKVSGVSETASIEGCDGFSEEGNNFVLKDIKEKEIEKYEKGKRFSCTLNVEPEETENKVVFQAQSSFSIELEYPNTIPVFT